MTTVRIEPNYKVTIPKNEREALGLKVGEEITITVHRSESLPTYTPTKRELAAIEKGREEMRKGQYYTLEQFREQLLGSPNKKARAKKPPSRTTA